MKSIINILFALISLNLYSQHLVSPEAEKSITEAIRQKARWSPHYGEIEKEGATWLQLTKVQDSILVRTLYSSSKEFDQNLTNKFASGLDDHLKAIIPEGKNVLVRVLFRTIDANSKSVFPNREDENIEEVIIKNKIRSPHIVQKTIIVNIYFSIK